MAAPEKKEEKVSSTAGVPLQNPGIEESSLHRPDEDIAHRPHLKVRPIGSRPPADAAKPAVRGGTLFRAQDKPEEPRVTEAKLANAVAADAAPKKLVSPAQEDNDARFAYATHRPPPPDEKAEKKALAALTAAKPEREVPTGLLLGVALILVALLSGIFIVRLTKKVGALEGRISRLERPEPRATVSAPKPHAPAPRSQPARTARQSAAKARTTAAAR